MQQFGKSTLSKYCIMDSYVVYKRKDDKEIKGYKELNFFIMSVVQHCLKKDSEMIRSKLKIQLLTSLVKY